MRSIIGLQTPDAGEVTVFGESMVDRDEDEAPAVRERWGVLFQGARPVLDPDRCRERPGSAQGILSRYRAGAARRDRHLQDRDERTGKRRRRRNSRPSFRAACASAPASPARSRLDPELLFLDEPTAGLDPIGAAAFDQLILELRDALGLTVFLITHDLDTLYAICDRVAVIADRKVMAVGTIPELLALDHEWIQEYFSGPRGRAAEERETRIRGEREGALGPDGNAIEPGARRERCPRADRGPRRCSSSGCASSAVTQEKTYDIFFRQSVDGLAKGTGVTFSRRSGRPDQVDQPRAEQSAVHPRAHHRPGRDPGARVGTTATIRGVGFTGVSQIQLDPPEATERQPASRQEIDCRPSIRRMPLWRIRSSRPSRARSASCSTARPNCSTASRP